MGRRVNKKSKPKKSITQKRVESYNRAFVKMKDELGFAPTERFELLTDYAKILMPKGEYITYKGKKQSSRGKIRTYEQVIRFMQQSDAGKAVLANKGYSKRQYATDVKNLMSALGKRATFSGEKRHQFNDMIKKITKYHSDHPNLFPMTPQEAMKLSFSSLLQAFRDAAEIEAKDRAKYGYDSGSRPVRWEQLLYNEVKKIEK